MFRKAAAFLLAALCVLSLFSCSYLDGFFPVSDEISESVSSSAVSEAPSSKEEVSAEEGGITVRFLDVGQGDSVLFEFPDGTFMMIDTGPSKSSGTLLSYLSEYGVSTLDYLIFTHPDADHIGCGADVINTVEVKNVIMTDAVSTSKTFDKLLTALESHESINIIQGFAGEKLEICGASFEILSPVSTDGLDSNQTSIVILMKYRDTSMIFMGDAEKYNEADIINRYGSSYLKADLLKVGHHGSSTSTSNAFLEAVSPEFAVILCGEGNSYNHPHKETVEKLESAGVEIYRTDINGVVTAYTDGSVIKITAGK